MAIRAKTVHPQDSMGRLISRFEFDGRKQTGSNRSHLQKNCRLKRSG